MEAEQYKNTFFPLRDNLVQYAKKLLNNSEEAEDVVQEVLLKLWFIRNKLKNYDNLPGLAMTMTKNLCINKLNDIRNREISIDNYLISFPDNQTPLQKLEEKDSMEAVLKIVDQLPSLQKLILRMKHLEGYETEEIALITGSSIESVRMNLSRARKKVKELFLEIK